MNIGKSKVKRKDKREDEEKVTRTVDIYQDGGCGVPSQTSHCEDPKIVSVSCFYRLTAERSGLTVYSLSLLARYI